LSFWALYFSEKVLRVSTKCKPLPRNPTGGLFSVHPWEFGIQGISPVAAPSEKCIPEIPLSMRDKQRLSPLAQPQAAEARIVTCRYELIDKLHAQNNQLAICNILAFLDAFALPAALLDVYFKLNYIEPGGDCRELCPAKGPWALENPI
jgi:hypothetical protein